MAELFTLPLFSDPTLVSYYRFEGNSNDSKSSNNGSDTSVTYNAGNGKYGQGAGGDGSATHIIYSGTGLNIAAPLTVNCWVNVDSSGSGTNQFVLSSDPNNTVGLSYNYTTSKWIFHIIDSGTGGGSDAQSGTTSKDAWHMLTWTYANGSSLLGYIDGVQVVNRVASGTLNSYDSGAYTLFDYSTTGSGLAFKGKLDDLCFFGKILSAAEIASLYNDNSGAFFQLF